MSRRKRISIGSPTKKQGFLIAGLCCTLLLGGCKNQSPARSEEKLTEAHLDEDKSAVQNFHDKLVEKLAADGLHSKPTERETDSLTFLVKVLENETNEFCLRVVKSKFKEVNESYANEFDLAMPSMSLELGDGRYLEFTIREGQKR